MDKPPVDSKDYYSIDKRAYTVGLFQLRNAGARPDSGKRGVFTLEELREVYLSTPTEYECAMRFVTEWDHWKAIVSAPSMKNVIASLRTEKRLRDQAEAQKLLWDAARKGNVSAQRALLDFQDEGKFVKAKKAAQAEEEERVLNKERAIVEEIRNNLRVISGKGSKAKNT